MLNVAFYTASICKLPWLDSYHQHLCFFGLEKETKRDILVRVTHFEPYLLVLPNQEDFLQYGNEAYLQHVCEELINENNKIQITKVMPEQRISSQSFTNTRLDYVLKLHFLQDWNRKPIYEYIEQQKKFGNIKIQCILHEKELHLLQAMHALNIQFHTWYQIPTYHALDERISSCNGYQVDVRVDTILPNLLLKNEQVELNVMYLRGFASSSLSTKTNLCCPSTEMDPILVICYQLNQEEPQILYNTNELDLLNEFHRILHQSNIHMVIFCSDENLKPNIMHYIHIRSQLIHADFHWSKIVNLDYRYDMEKGNKYVKFPGIEHLDIAKCLQKAMCNPPLAEYTLLHLVRHKNLIKKDDKSNALFETFYDPNYEPPNQFCTMDQITTDLAKQVQIMSQFIQQSGTLPNLLTVSSSYDLEPKNVMERGQQIRILHKFFNDYHQNGLYYDHLTVNIPSVLLPKERQESSFPDPPKKNNPNVFELIESIPPKKVTFSLYPTRQKRNHEICDNTNNKNISSIIVDINADINADINVDKKEQDEEKEQTEEKEQEEEQIEDEEEDLTAVAKESYGGGLVLNPIPGFWSGVRYTVITCDWAAMYPNIIKSNNICPMTLIRDSKWLQDPKCTLQFIPRNKHQCDVRIIAYDGKPVTTFLPRVVSQFLALREEQRTLKQNAKTKQEELARAMAELALKASANACYGFFGARTSPMCSFAIASMVTQIGQHMQKTVRYRILTHRNPSLYNERKPENTGGAVLYGDTDSCMAVFPVSKHLTDEKQILEEILKQGTMVTDYATSYFTGNKIIVESWKSPLWMLPHKKTYVAIEYEKGKPGKEKMKGIGSIKRDKCGIARETGVTLAHNILYRVFTTNQEYVRWLKTILDQVPFTIPPHFLALEPFILSAQLKKDYKNNVTLAKEVAEKIEMETGSKPLPNDRVSFVFAYLPHEKFHAKKAFPPRTFLKRKYQLDCQYYFEVQIFGCIKQLLSLPMHAPLLNMLHALIKTYVEKWNVYCMILHSASVKT